MRIGLCRMWVYLFLIHICSVFNLTTNIFKTLESQWKIHCLRLRHSAARGHTGNALPNARQRILRLRRRRKRHARFGQPRRWSTHRSLHMADATLARPIPQEWIDCGQSIWQHRDPISNHHGTTILRKTAIVRWCSATIHPESEYAWTQCANRQLTGASGWCWCQGRSTTVRHGHQHRKWIVPDFGHTDSES